MPETLPVPVETTPPFNLDTYIAEVGSSKYVRQQQSLAASYDAACRAVIGDNDIQKEGAREFKKKSAWRKLARYFNISSEVVKIDRTLEHVGDHDLFIATVTVRAVAPWGQHSEAVGACGTDEAVGRRVITIADAIATAETRATNRAVSNLVAMGEVSAEEIGDRESERSGPLTTIPFGNDKGKPLADCSVKHLHDIKAWCLKKDAWPDLVEGVNLELERRRETAVDGVATPSTGRDSDTDGDTPTARSLATEIEAQLSLLPETDMKMYEALYMGLTANGVDDADVAELDTLLGKLKKRAVK